MSLTSKVYDRMVDHWDYRHARPYSREEMAQLVANVAYEHFQDVIGWYQQELELVRDQVEELEIDLMMKENEFGTVHNIQPKKWSNWA